MTKNFLRKFADKSFSIRENQKNKSQQFYFFCYFLIDKFTSRKSLSEYFFSKIDVNHF